MNCPFCHSPQAATSRACRVCGGPLRAEKPKIAPIPVFAPKPNPVELARRVFDVSSGALSFAGFSVHEIPRVVFGNAYGDIHEWNLETGTQRRISTGRLFRKANLVCCATLANNLVALGHQTGEVRWHALGGRVRKNPASHVGRVLALASNVTHLYSGGNDGVIWATEIDDRKSRSRALLDGLGAMTTFAVSPDASSVAVGCDDGAVELWRFDADEAAFQLDWTRREHSAPIESLAFSPNGQMIISRDRNRALSLWAAQTSYQLPLPSGAQSSHVAPAFSSDNQLLALSERSGVAIFDVALGSLLHQLPSSAEEITHLSFASRATWLLLASAREIAVWNIL